jgi:hypothetical protein
LKPLFSKHPEEEHVSQDVEDVAVQEHRSEDRRQIVLSRDESVPTRHPLVGGKDRSGSKHSEIRDD